MMTSGTGRNTRKGVVGANHRKEVFYMTYLEIFGWAHKGLVGERVALESKADLAASKGVKDLESYCRKQAAVMEEKLKVLDQITQLMQ